MSNRILIGVAAAGLMVGGVGIYAGLFGGDATSGGIALRSGLVLGAVWLAMPAINRLTWRGTLLVAVLVLAVALKPVLLWVVPIAVLLVGMGRWRVKERSRK